MKTETTPLDAFARPRAEEARLSSIRFAGAPEKSRASTPAAASARLPLRERLFLALTGVTALGTPLLGIAAWTGSETVFAVACAALCCAGLLLLAMMPIIFRRK